MESYYKEILHTIRTHMSERNYEKAFRLLEDELAMPYIPKQSEQELIELYNECRSELRAQKGQRSYQEADLETLLYGDMDEALMAVELLKSAPAFGFDRTIFKPRMSRFNSRIVN